ncbi:MAG: hypothetical protein GQ557_00820, partial [Mycoplasmataceae bacterium]|nr:hypothetical protein [Mycoplasmataceae bacterium]
FTMIGALFVTGYAFHVQKSPGKSVVADDHDKNLEWAKQNFGTLDVSDHRKTTKREITGLILFASAFIIMIFMYIPWTSFFDSYATHVDDNGFIYPPGLGWLFNGMNYPGVWYFGELVMEFLLFSLAIGYVFKMKLSEISDAMWTGAKDILPVAIIIGVARAIPQVMTESSMDVFLVGSLTNNLGGLSPIVFLMVIFIVFLILACFIPSTSGLAGLSMPIIAAIAVSIFADQPGFGGPDGDGTILMLGYIIIMFSIAVGLINMFIPTQAIVLASAEAAKVPYTKMLKPVLIYSGGLAIFTLVVVAPILGAIVV